ncbi:MAG: ABC transporter ATP-binding protein/permease [Beijerinckiaceae bacterium]|nr:ABC transporter ATP-binding protein/permease [Beijerinckiaceae bacterium]
MTSEPSPDTATSFGILRRLVREHGQEHASAYIGAAVLLMLAAGATAWSAYLLKPVVNGMVAGTDFKQLRALAWLVAGLFTARGIVTFLSVLILARTGNRIVANVQRRLFDHLAGQDMQFFHENRSSDFMTRLSFAAASVRATLQSLIMGFSRDFLTLVGLVVVMFLHDPLLAGMSLLALPVGGFVLSQLIGRIRKSARRTYDGTGSIMQILQETVLGSRIVKSFNLEDHMRRRMHVAVREVEKACNRVAASVAMSGPVSDALAGIAIGAVIFYGSWRISIGGADPGSFFSFIAALLLAYDPAKRLARLKLDIQNGVTGAQLIYGILDRPALEDSRDALPGLQLEGGKVSFEKVTFRYRPDEKVLDAISFVAEPNQTTALVGPSGGGKSTIISLLQRFYVPESGLITLDRQDINAVNLRSLRQQIAFVSQDVFLFDGTIRENIGFGREGASDDDIIEAARKAYAHDFICRFSQGYDTNVGESGAQLSGGQKQRIAIARAILKNAPIILLDEPTAALDSESERIVQQALDALRQGRTTIVVAHRLQTIIKADRIYVIDHGGVVQSGNHTELVAQEGTYQTYFSGQFGQNNPA